MKRIAVALSLIFTLPLSVSAQWFEQNTMITRMHQQLLEDDLSGMFELMIQVWQQESSDMVTTHLDGLLKQSLEKDCGKSLIAQSLPNWLSAVTVNKLSIERPGRYSYELELNLTSESFIDSIELVAWPNSQISTDVVRNNSTQQLVGDQTRLHTAQVTYNLTRELEIGLYQLTVQDNQDRQWNSWLVIDTIEPAHIVRWDSRQTWAVDKVKLLHPHCPLPKLDVAVIDFEKGSYQSIWENSYEARYPVTLPTQSFPADRYIVTVSMTNSRWQGPILYKNEHTLTKTLDLNQE